MELRLSALLSLCLLLGLVCPSQSRAEGRCPRKQTCNKCIQAGPECAWCGGTELTAAQCNTEEKLVAAGCGGHIYNPKGGLLSIANESRRQEGGPVQVTVVRLNLRPGVVQSVPLNLPKGQQKTTEVTLETSPVPEHISIAFNDTDSPWLKQVNVEAISCPRRGNESWTVTITPKGFPLLLELQLTLECVCECMKDHEKSSPACGGRGVLECGRCMCSPPYSGGRCETRRLPPPPPPPPTPGDEHCRDGPEAPMCSGRGACEYGDCVCDSRADPAQRYTGRFCECSDFDCLYSENKLCGGHGRCQCGQCVCDADWTGEACNCSMDMGPCMGAYQKVCSYRGMCVCATCVCEEPFQGATCEHSPY